MIASISSEKDKYLDKSMELPEEIQLLYHLAIDKFIDFNKELKDNVKKQELLEKKEIEKGSFFGLLLEG